MAGEQPRGFWDRRSVQVFAAAGAAFTLLAVFASLGAIAIARNAQDQASQVKPTSVGNPNDQVIDFGASPPATFEAFDPVLAPAPTGTTHRIELEATEEVMEIAPGVSQVMWTFNGSVPGPVIRGKVGDTFEIKLTNAMSAENGHSIDFHASKVAPNIEMRTIAPGESLDYVFTADHSGIFMYHCGTGPVLHHVGMGMYGAIVIDPPDLDPVDHEFVMVQSELYTAPPRGVASMDKMLADAWDAVVFNGYPNQYVHEPLKVEAGERVRVWVQDVGPSENSSFHVIGTIFDTVFKEGAYRLRNGETTGGGQALDLQPAQGGFVEFDFAVDGIYPFVTHKFSNASIGAMGIFQVGDVDPSESGGH